MIKLTKDVVLTRLRQNGLIVKYKKHTKIPIAIEAPIDLHIGIKLWGYIDFLKLPFSRVVKRRKKNA